MRLTDHTDYSLRVLIYLNTERRMITLNELSEKLKISKNNLIKASAQLASLKFIATSKGPKGGLLIKAETGSKTLKDIITKTEESFLISGCFTKKTCSCSLRGGCYLKRRLTEALEAFFLSLGNTTLNEVTENITSETKQLKKGML